MPSLTGTPPLDRLDRYDCMALGGDLFAEDPYAALRLKLEDHQTSVTQFTPEELAIIRAKLAALAGLVKLERQTEPSADELVANARHRLRRYSTSAPEAA